MQIYGTCPSSIVKGGGGGVMEGDILWNTVIFIWVTWPYLCFLCIQAQCSSSRSEVTPVSICSLLYYRLDTGTTGPLPSRPPFFGCEANLFLRPHVKLDVKMISDFCKSKNKALFSIPRLLQCVVTVILFLLLVITTSNYIPNKETVMSGVEKIQDTR